MSLDTAGRPEWVPPAGYPRPRDRVCVVWVYVPHSFTSAAGGRARSPALSSHRSMSPKIQNTDIVSLFNPQRLHNVCEVSQYRRCPLKRMRHVMTMVGHVGDEL